MGSRAIWLALLLGACPPEPAAPVPAAAAARRVPSGSLLGRGAASYVLYYTEGPATDPASALERLARGTPFALQVAPAESGPPSVRGWTPDLSRAPPPEAPELAALGRGLSPEERVAVAGARAAYALRFSYPAEGAGASLRAAEALAVALARATQGVLQDAATNEVFSLPAWALLRGTAWRGGAPVAAGHLATRLYRHGSGYRLATRGMEKLGLPDVCVEDFASDDLGAVATLADLAVASLLAHPQARAAGQLETGLARPAALPVRLGAPDEGDAANRLLELEHPASLLREVAALPRPAAREAEPPPGAAAGAGLPERRAAVAEDLAGGARLEVRAPLRALSESGALWVDVLQWRGRLLVGVLLGAPPLGSTLPAGGRVTLDEGEVAGWLLLEPDGGVQGSEPYVGLLRAGR